MAYTSNPHMPKARGDAVRLVKIHGWSQAKVARHFGVDRVTIYRWLRKAPDDLRRNIPTLSSRPKHSANQLDMQITVRIIETRKRINRCAPVVHQTLLNEGIRVSLSSVRRTLERQGLVKRQSGWKRYRPYIPRPSALTPGDLVQADTIHFVDPRTNTRFYLYTAIDLYTRKAYAKLVPRINARASYLFLEETQKYFGFKVKMVQTDNGPEFSKWFNDMLASKETSLRHSRIHKPNDNAHIERFNRTIQEECIKGDWDYARINKKVKTYLDYYNNQRLHLGIGLATPFQMSKTLQRS